MFLFHRKLCLVAVVVVLAQGASSKEPSKEIIDDWKWLEKEVAVVNGTVTEVLEGAETNKFQFALQGDLGKSTQIIANAAAKEEIRLFDSNHSFKLTKSNSAAGNWVLANVLDRNADPLVTNMSTYVRMNVCIGNDRLLDMASSDQYRFGDWIESDGKVTTKIEYLAPEPRRYDFVEVDFDPKNHHRIMKTVGSKQFPQGERITEHVCFYSSSNIPDKVVATFSGAGSPATLEFLYSDVSTTPKPTSEFTLGHFGLPEYAAPRKKSSTNVYIIAGVCLICSTIAFVLLRRKTN